MCLVPGSVKDKKKKKKKKKRISYFLIVRLSQIMHFKSQKYIVDQLFVHYKNQLSEFIFKEIMQTRWFYIVNFWIHLQYIFIIVIWLIFIFFFYHFLFITETWQKNTCAWSTIHGSWEDYAEIVAEFFYGDYNYVILWRTLTKWTMVTDKVLLQGNVLTKRHYLEW